MSLPYRQYDRAALDIQYNARATVADVAPLLRQYALQSQHARDTLPCVLDVAFGDHPDESLDIFPAPATDADARNGTGTALAPVFLFIHGGYWRLLSKSDSSCMAPLFTQAGAVVVALNYSLAPAATLDRIVDQTRRALAWIHRNIARHGGDPARIHVCGSSAGGHLAGMLLAGGWHADYGLPDDAVHSATALSGLFDLTPLVHTHINDWMNLSPEDARRNSPLFALPARGCPLLISHGANETDEFKRQSADYLAAWRARGYAGGYVDMPGTNHFDIVLRLNDAQAPITQAILAQMGLRAAGVEARA